MSKIFSKVKTQFEALHCYPDAPEEVAFLRNKHRHIFNVILWIQENESRELEYFMIQHKLKGVLNLFEGKDLGATSCENLAETILEMARNTYPSREIRVEVNEDGENGCLIE